jgi:hypothetical protein
MIQMMNIDDSISSPEQDRDMRGIGVQEAAFFINQLSDAEYWAARLPCAEDAKITEICAFYQQLSPRERIAFKNMITQNGYFVLSAYSTRMAMLGVRKRQESWLIYGIVALTIGWTTPYVDQREILMNLAPLYHSAQIVGDPRHIFEAGVQHVEDERLRQLILGFLDRDPRDQRPEAMGWEIIQGPSGLIYRFDDQPIPEGHL